MKKSSIKIKGDTWKIFKVPQVHLGKLLDEKATTAEAFTEFGKKSIYFSDFSEYFTEATIMHELTHCYVGYLCLDSATTLRAEQLEEIYCEMFANNYKAMIANLKEIKRKLK